MSLMREIRAFPVPRGSVALWWLGQNGFIFKSAEGTLLSTDLYLTDSCVSIAPAGTDFHRQVPVLIPPEEVDVDLFAVTHNHQDHTDPETIERLRHKDTAHFIGPHPSCGVFRDKGVEAGRILPCWPDGVLELRDIVIRGTFALPTDDTDLNHMGYVFEFGNGPRVYMTGDTDACELLASARRHEPHLMITCINGGFNNLSHDEAAQLAARIQPQAAIPCHYDMFADNAIDPRQFRASLGRRAPEVGYLQPEHGKPLVFSV
jgi:L-ascorbate metabolism protein UlaG (beta-lactamase superfamily)